MKRTLSLALSMLILASTYAAEIVVNTKVLQSFNQTFTAAEEIRWSESSDSYSVTFTQRGIRARVNYDKNGSMKSSIRYYSPDFLPLNILNQLNENNKGYTPFGVTEVTVGDQMVYFIKLEDAKSWITVKVSAVGESQLSEKYSKN